MIIWYGSDSKRRQDVLVQTCYIEQLLMETSILNESTSDLSLTIIRQVPHLIIVQEEGKADKTEFLRKKPLSSVCIHVHTYMHACTVLHACIHTCKYACTHIYITSSCKKIYKHGIKKYQNTCKNTIFLPLKWPPFPKVKII